MVPPPSIPDEQIAEAYARLKSVWAVGRELGMAGQTVHKRMVKANIPIDKRYITPEDRIAIKKYYEETSEELFYVPDLANKLGLSRIAVTRCARSLGLTKKGRPHNTETRARQGVAMSRTWKANGHPRGAFGLKHTDAAKEKMSRASKLRWATAKAFGIGNMAPEEREKKRLRMAKIRAGQSSQNAYSRTAGGRREDLGDTWFRSSWEANYARYLNLLQKMGIVTEWSYEPETFWFEGVKRGCVSYRPDFKVSYKNDPKPEYIEIKGWVTPKDKTKWKRMKKYHSHIKLTVIAQKEYREIENRWRGALSNWESGRKPTFTRLLGKEASLEIGMCRVVIKPRAAP